MLLRLATAAIVVVSGVTAPAASASTITTTAASGVSTGPAGTAPAVVQPGTVTLTGTSVAGETLTAVVAGWEPDTTYTYSWNADGVALDGQRDASWLLTDDLIGRSITVDVTGQHPSYDVTMVTSNALVVRARPLVTSEPVIVGEPSVGSVLTAQTGDWTSGTVLTYVWLVGGVEVPGATGPTFTVRSTDVGKAVSVRVTGTLSGYATESRTSALTPYVVPAGVPSITGTPIVANVLTANPGVWAAGTTLTYQWYADGKAISKATASSLTLGSVLRDKRISVRITGAKTGHPTVVKTSVMTPRVMTAGVPAAVGVTVYGGRLVARVGTWTAGTTYRYQWDADGRALAGATRSSLTLGSATRGKRITVRVTGSRAGYATVVRFSAATLRVATAGTPSVGGSPLVTYTLTARRGTWTAGTVFTYRWFANGSALAATGPTLTVGAGLAGKRISVRVTGSLRGYPTLTRLSSATPAVGYPSRTGPVSAYNCPSWAPIKGNASSMIYHMPGQRFYKATKPEDCFRTESAAKAAGYRKAKV